MHERFIEQDSDEAKEAKDLVEFVKILLVCMSARLVEQITDLERVEAESLVGMETESLERKG